MSLAILASLIAVWEVMSRSGLISPLLAPAPSAVLCKLVDLLATRELAPHLFATLFRVLAGITIGGSVGIIIGLLMGLFRRFRDIADPFVAAIHPVPKIAILPVVMALLGIGDASRIAVVSLAVFFPLMINTMNGVREISQTHLDVARNYGATGAKLFSRVVLPASLPMVLSGLRIAVNMALLITIAIEIAGATRGLGALIWVSWEVLRIEAVYATLLVIMCLGVTLNAIMKVLAVALVPWAREEKS